jgi:hypothetical protein
MANPMGPDDNNIAMRIRGYLNVANTFGGQPITFVVKCDDGCALRIGKSMQLVMQANDDSPQLTGRRARWVSFTDPGLYPIEIVYFQNSTTGYLEWSWAYTSLFTGDDVAVDNVQWGQQVTNFQPLSGDYLYSGIIGSNPSCLECGAPGMDCTAGNYCGDGLCQACNLPDHCGPTCMRCPLDRRMCRAGKCVQCQSDAMCPPGGSCDPASGTCRPPVICTAHAACKPPQVCWPAGYCGNLPDNCLKDADCPPEFSCDSGLNQCKRSANYLYEGGLVGCSMGSGSSVGSARHSLLILFGIALFCLILRRRDSVRVIAQGRTAK